MSTLLERLRERGFIDVNNPEYDKPETFMKEQDLQIRINKTNDSEWMAVLFRASDGADASITLHGDRRFYGWVGATPEEAIETLFFDDKIGICGKELTIGSQRIFAPYFVKE